jgi:alkanesulfonate monooxygenase SsuD/methylene tetrahydromethanopterin reductase-like flavin-dependent oxidoreductase (luciferase family)
VEFVVYLSFPNIRPRRIPDARFFESQIELAVLAEELGYDRVWTAGHHGTEMYYPSQFLVLTAIAARTKRIRIGPSVIPLPLYHPLYVTEEAATLDVISDGRLDLGVGAGNFLSDFRAYGVSRSERATRMDEGLEIITGLWTQEEFSFEGKHWTIPPFTLNPRPVQKKPPLWCAATVPKAFDRAARFGCHLAGTGPFFDVYEERLRSHGHDPADFHKSILQFLFVAETREQAWEVAAPALLHFVHFYKQKLDEHDDFKFFREQPGGYFGVDPLPKSPADIDAIRQLNFLGAPFVVGTPDDAADSVVAAQQRGVTHLAMWTQLPGIDTRHVEQSLRLFAHEVMPRFRSKS